jgi:hypothetical protein
MNTEQATQAEAEQLAKKAVADYLSACRMANFDLELDTE